MQRREIGWLAALGVGLFLLFSWLPSTMSGVLASPDETAVAVTAEVIRSGRAYFTLPPSVFTPGTPSLHPRSWVTVGHALAPVGFLGWPWFLSFFVFLGGTPAIVWIGMFLILSSAWPLFQLLKRFGFWSAWIGTLIAFTAPGIIIYANRGLFPNGAVVALTLWSLWLMKWLANKQQKTKNKRQGVWGFFRDDHVYAFVILGALVGLIAAMRPIELVWIIPWWVWAWGSMWPDKRQARAMIIALFVVLLPVASLAQSAYGSWFSVGYLEHDQAPISSGGSAVGAPHAPAIFLPFGFHPRNLMWNIGAYLIRLLWPWTILSLLALILSKPTPRGGRLFVRKHGPWLASLWTILTLLFIYGQGVYRDNILGHAAIGNSFIRYLLPGAVLSGVGAAFLWREIARERFRMFASAEHLHRGASVFVAILVLFGIYRAFLADEEGLWYTRRELKQYARIREEALAYFKPGDVIFSERSDKIFFPTFLGVSPLPAAESLVGLERVPDTRMGLFARPLSQSQKDAWISAGLEPQELISFPRETLYRFMPRRPR